jgi:hypothetical protein
VGSRAGLDAVAKKNTLPRLHRESNSSLPNNCLVTMLNEVPRLLCCSNDKLNAADFFVTQ